MSYFKTKSRVCSFVQASESFFKALQQTKVNTLQQVNLGHHIYSCQQFCWKQHINVLLRLSKLLRLTFECSAFSSMGCCAISSSGAESCSCNLHHSMWGQGSEIYQKHLPFRIPSRGFRWKTSLQLWLHDQVSLAVPLMQYGVLVVYMLTNYQQKGTPYITISQKFPEYLNSCTEILVPHLYVAHHQIWVLWGSNNLLGKDGFTSHQACGCTTPRWWWLLRSKINVLKKGQS